MQLLRIGKNMLPNSFWTNMSIHPTDDPSHLTNIVQKESSTIHTLEDSRSVVQSPRVSSATSTSKIQSSDGRSHIPRQNLKRRYRKCGPLIGSNRCCCYLAIALLIFLGLSAIIATVVAVNLTKKITTVTSSISVSVVPTTSFTGTTINPNTTISPTATVPLNSTLNTNLVANGNGESGSCQTGGGITHPTGWNYNGTVTQVSYNNPTYGAVLTSNPGPSDRGQCYFFGQQSLSTSMWQTIDMSGIVDPLLIDNQTVMFNLSAWIGGWNYQNDNAYVSVTFMNQANQVVGNRTTIGPVLAAARNNQSALLFRQVNGLVPIGARSLTLLVTFVCVTPTSNDGAIDNIAFLLYQ